jgi:hypothetical protein
MVERNSGRIIVKLRNGLRKTKSAALLTTAAATAGLAVTVLVAPAAHADTPKVWGCDPGWVCIYQDSKEFSPITQEFFTYGAHNLQNQFDFHDIVNNQTGGATVTLCYGYNGVNCTGPTLLSYEVCCAYGINLTPINSIRLNRP